MTRPSAIVSSNPTTSRRPTTAASSRRACKVDRRGIGEQQQGEGGLGKQLDRLRLGLDGDPAEHLVGQQEADDDEGERRADGYPVEPRGDECVARDEQGHRGQLETHCELPVLCVGGQGT